MYSAKFINRNGKSFSFGYESGSLFDIKGLTGYNVDIAASQGYNQIGQTIENQTVKNGLLKISGKLLGPAKEKKKAMLSAFVPMTMGTLIFEGKYFVDCAIKKTPAIQAVEKNPKFSIQLYAPYPFWRKKDSSSFVIGDYTPAFSFPVNYATPHIFGIKSDSLFVNCYNPGQIESDYSLRIRTMTETTNPGILNVMTQEKFKLNGTIHAGEILEVYKYENRLRVELERDGLKQDVFSWLDEDSDLLSLHVGDNLIRVTADAGENQIIASISFFETVVGVYEGI